MRGVLRWRESNWDAAERDPAPRPRARRGGGAQRGRASPPSTGWRAALRDRGDYAGADTALTQALDVCERAGPRRAVDGGDRGAGAHPRAVGPHRAGPRGGRGDPPALRAPPVPGRQRRRARGDRRDGRRPRRRARSCSPRRARPGRSSAARSTRPAASCIAAGSCSRSSRPRRRRSWSAPPRAPRSSASATSPTAPATLAPRLTMASWRQQALIEAPVEEVWRLVGDPGRYPEWAGEVIEP